MVAPAERVADRLERGVGQRAGQMDRDLARPGHAGGPARGGRAAPAPGRSTRRRRSGSRRPRSTRRRLSAVAGGSRRGPVSASRTSIGSCVSEWYATILIRAPSSTRTLSVMRSAISSSTASSVDRDAVERGALAEDGDAGRVVGRLDHRHEARLEPLAQPLLDRHELAREPVAGEHELAPGLVQRVERVEELLLGLGLAGEELDVVDQQDVGVAVGLLEAVERSRPERPDEVVGERLDGRVADDRAAAEREDVVADRVEEVGLAEARRGVQEQRVVGLAREARRPPAPRRGRGGCRRR